MPKRLENLTIRNANIKFRNFAGAEKPFNTAGDRNFCVFLEPDLAEQMVADGWNVKFTKVREEGDEAKPYVEVAVEYRKGRPPRVVLLSSSGRTDLGADEVKTLDIIDIKNADVILNPYPWDVNGNSGIKAYLKSGFFTIDEDELEQEYAQVPDLNPMNQLSSTANEEEMANV